jgi:hypothetical protein
VNDVAARNGNGIVRILGAGWNGCAPDSRQMRVFCVSGLVAPADRAGALGAHSIPKLLILSG